MMLFCRFLLFSKNVFQSMSSLNFFSLVYDIEYMSKHPQDYSNLINQTLL